MELMTLHRLKQRLENERQRYARQQEREELLSRRMQRTRQNIENLEYALQSLERIISLHRRHRVIPHAEIDSFFDRASAVYDRLQARLHLNLSYSFSATSSLPAICSRAVCVCPTVVSLASPPCFPTLKRSVVVEYHSCHSCSVYVIFFL